MQPHLLKPFAILLAIILLSACTSPTQPPVLTAEPATPVPAPTSTPTARPSSTPVPEDTPTQTPTLPAPASTLTATPTEFVCRETQGRIVQKQLETTLLPDPLDFRVYFPPCYTSRPVEEGYPVLYLIHGQSYNDDQWDRLGADETADALITSGEVVPFLIVMPRDRVWFEPDRDMFGRAVAEELVPWIDQTYKTLPDRRYRAIGGLSRGGAWSLHLGLSRWDLFGAFGAHSLAMFGYDAIRMPDLLNSIPEDEMPRIYLDMDDRDRPDLIRTTTWFETLLTEKNIPHEWYFFPGYHEEKYWASHVEQYLRWYAAGWVEVE